MSCTVWGNKEGGLQTLVRLIAERTLQGFQNTQEGPHSAWGSRVESGNTSWRRHYRRAIMKKSPEIKATQLSRQESANSVSLIRTQDTHPHPRFTPHPHPCSLSGPWTVFSFCCLSLCYSFPLLWPHSQGKTFASYFTKAFGWKFLLCHPSSPR